MSKNGRRHDKRLLDKVDIIRHIPPEVTIWADTGFQGIAKRHYFDNSQLCFFAAYQGIGCNHF
ncbi:hypothetical protein [Symbiopectobacterium purcellii]